MTEQATRPLDPHVVRDDEGEARWWFSSLAVIRVTAADTGGLMTIVEVNEPPGHEAPLHVHHREDEAFYILEGSATIHVGDESFEVGPGDYALGPRDSARALVVVTPAGFERMFEEGGVPAADSAQPPEQE